ncbi:phospho ribosylaminoimidazole-succinocarboxamide synthase [Companilactobacillus mindensis DSM 14500]|jgi:phosphoribosylaminoimidazole-succinocarboxamide synthase|uniref:Phosphoribosylaminoimidazole-succinocarboxamide synthase n=1 Tax=Companilactobacillus mindensis DSM 14500 TaxID=1423770 RepID=A0A0R1QY73_9LACO|nr:phosphoribosylaminoimidazolesuccinocarboxamide synthase [Companilactobacillus mindensis]KRL46136.1 phospho ribosylaminoimidazole-succinocarboxamide synthase [Companilactobacillus mindensis DSM 14500]GEO78585.1 phosphoribosylaminoimidazole-succinocarboxamide synthase [Companilactobacillus mindensis]
MTEDKLLYTGKAKNVYQADNEDEVLIVYKDQATALNGKKKEHLPGKGVLDCRISQVVFDYLIQNGIKTHLVKNISDHEQLVKKTDVFPLEVVLRNITSGSLVKKFHVEAGQKLAEPIIEFYYKSDALDDPFINESQIHALGIADKKELEYIKEMTLKVNDLLVPFFAQSDFDLVDFKLEFGKYNGEIILVDEFSPDNCRLWDKTSHHSMDKDVFRKHEGDLVETYHEVLQRLTTK